MLDVSDLDLKYGQSQILFDVSLSAQVGKITAVIGNNGVGKTSLLKAISGRHPVMGGSASVDGTKAQLSSAYHAARAGGSVNDDFEVTHNGVVIATISPSTTTSFTTTEITITGLSGTDTIGFREIASQDNGLGPLLDNIQISLTEAEVASGVFSYDDIIDGGAGDDIIYGQEGDDIITGGTGNDYIEGGIGNDVGGGL